MVVNGMVGNNISRPLAPEEVLGFALVNEYAPMIFVNGVDFIASQTFSLVHEFTHICIGRSGLSADLGDGTGYDTAERFCNPVAEAYLVPAESLERAWQHTGAHNTFQKLARTFKVSEAVVVRKLHDDGLISSDIVREFFQNQYHKPNRQSSVKGGNFWLNQRYRLGNRFASLIDPALREQRLDYRTGQHIFSPI